MTNRFNTPVLFIVFNRPDTTQLVFAAIRAIRPPRLFIAADGPRKHVPEDVAKCNATRRIVSQVDWDCEVKTLFRDENLNCGVAPSSAISWFFEHEEQGIILEDDCVPSQSFFWFCEELLEKYKTDRRIMHIGGNSFVDGFHKTNTCSYYFSRNAFIWGWATWRRAWALYDFNMVMYEELKRHGYFNNYFLNPLEKMYRLKKFEATVTNTMKDWWDYQWDFARYIHSGLAIVPTTNLVSNIGFGNDATHTLNVKSRHANVSASEIEFPLKHPEFIARDVRPDRRFFSYFIKEAIKSKLPV